MSAFADPPQTAKAAATRERLLELAAQMFIRDGYTPVSLRDIADEAGLTKGAIYGHFRSKGQLLVEVIRHDAERVGELRGCGFHGAFEFSFDKGERTDW